MDHVAILNKSWHLLDKIVSGEKTIESRWYKNKAAPWNKIVAGEIVYFKESGEPISLKAEVDKVLQFSDISKGKVQEILEEYGKEIGITANKKNKFVQRFANKRYCILIFLKNVEKIPQFNIDKRGFGVMSAWLCIEDITKAVST